MKRLNIISIVIGVAFFLTLNGAIDWYSYYKGSPPISGWLSIWDKYGFHLLATFIILIPGFITGYLSKKHSLTNGIIVALIGSLIVALGPTVIFYNFSPYYDFVFSSLHQYGIYCILMSIIGEHYYIKSANKKLNMDSGADAPPPVN